MESDMTTVVNVRKSDYDVYIGQPSKWGNPFRIGKDGDRTDVVLKYAAYLSAHPELVEEAKKELSGKILGCFCKPKLCHGDVLAAVADNQNTASEGEK